MSGDERHTRFERRNLHQFIVGERAAGKKGSHDPTGRAPVPQFAEGKLVLRFDSIGVLFFGTKSYSFQLNTRVRNQVDEKKRLLTAMSPNVTPEGQRLFIAIGKTINTVRWRNSDIIVWDEEVIPFSLFVIRSLFRFFCFCFL